MHLTSMVTQPSYYSTGSFSQNASVENRPVVSSPSSQNAGPSMPAGVLPVVAVTPVLIEPDFNQPRKPGLGKAQVLKIEFEDGDGAEV